MNNNREKTSSEGILLVNKPKGRTSFSLVSLLRKLSGVKKIGHAGTLDPLATGVMVLLIGRNFTKLCPSFLTEDKEYLATLFLGAVSTTYDAEGPITSASDAEPSLQQILSALSSFQGKTLQIPPMFSAKKVKGEKLYNLARKGIEVERAAVEVDMNLSLVSYHYPYLYINIACSKGTYIRSFASDLGKLLGCGAYLSELSRTRSGRFCLHDCVEFTELIAPGFPLHKHLRA